MGNNWGIILTIVTFGVGQLAGLGILIFHIGSKFQQLTDHERRITALEQVQGAMVPALAEIRGREKTAC